MAVYAIGDVQGCLVSLTTLLERIHFDRHQDTLWFTGDLVDRGKHSLEVLRYAKNLEEKAVVVLGNHDLHLLATAAGAARIQPHNKFKSILEAPDKEELLTWLGTRSLLHHDATLGYTMVHAGLLPQWELSEALELAREIEHIIAWKPESFFPHMFGDHPNYWDKRLCPPDRWRVAVNAFTRLRYCGKKGNMALRHNEPPALKPPHLTPWFDIPRRRSMDSKIIFGHWSTLGLCRGKNFIALDSGCGWGGDLTAARLDVSPVRFFSVPCPDMEFSENSPKLTLPVPNPEEATYQTAHVTRIIPEMV